MKHSLFLITLPLLAISACQKVDGPRELSGVYKDFILSTEGLAKELEALPKGVHWKKKIAGSRTAHVKFGYQLDVHLQNAKGLKCYSKYFTTQALLVAALQNEVRANQEQLAILAKDVSRVDMIKFLNKMNEDHKKSRPIFFDRFAKSLSNPQ